MVGYKSKKLSIYPPSAQLLPNRFEAKPLIGWESMRMMA